MSEQMQYGYAVRGVLYDVQEAYLLYQEGGLDDGYWKTRAASILAYLAQEPACKIYRQDKSKGILHSDFVRWLDSSMQSQQGGKL